MSDGDALLATILAEPDEDTPRLVYADYLQENGQPERAEFIRVQCADPDFAVSYNAATAGLAPVTPSRETALALLRRLGHRWLGPYYEAAGGCGRRWAWHRGFVPSVAVSAAVWSGHGDAICAAQPLRSVTFTDEAPTIEDTREAERDGQWCNEYLVAGRWVSVPAAELFDVLAPDLREAWDRNARLIFSRRWPSVPPEGWTFPPPPAVSTYTTARFLADADPVHLFVTLHRVNSASFAGFPPGTLQLDRIQVRENPSGVVDRAVYHFSTAPPSPFPSLASVREVWGEVDFNAVLPPVEIPVPPEAQH